jgi:HK97 family phage portal protein
MGMTFRSRITGAFQYLKRGEQRPRVSEWDDFWYSKQPYESSTGSEVSEDVALTYSAVWACVKVISEDLASLPLFLYRRDGKTKEKADDQDIYWLLHDAPNPEMTSMQFRECLQAHLLTWGNAYAEIQRNLRGQPTSLWPLNPGQMKVTRPGNELVYEYTITGGTKKLFSREDIFHIPGMGFNGIIGYSPIGYQREAIGVGLAAQQWQGSNIKNGGRLQLAFVHPAERAPNEEGRKLFAKKIREEYGGKNGQAIAVLWEGMEPKKIGMTMEDAQFIESRKFNRSEICSIYRVPPHKIQDLERATFSNIEQQSISYVIDAIRPWAVRWEQAINQRLLGNSGKFFAEHQMDGLLRGDIASRYAAYSIGRQWGWLSVNDIRSLENMNPVPKGDGYLQPLNMGELGEKPELVTAGGKQEAPVTDAEKEAAARAIRKLRIIGGE